MNSEDLDQNMVLLFDLVNDVYSPVSMPFKEYKASECYCVSNVITTSSLYTFIRTLTV